MVRFKETIFGMAGHREIRIVLHIQLLIFSISHILKYSKKKLLPSSILLILILILFPSTKRIP